MKNRKQFIISFIAAFLCFIIVGSLAMSVVMMLDNGKIEESAEYLSYWADRKLSYEDGELKVGYSFSGDNVTGFTIYTDNLKPNSLYNVSWTIDSNFESLGFSEYTKYFEENDETKSCILYFTKDETPRYPEYIVLGENNCTITKGDIMVKTDDYGHLTFLLLLSDGASHEAAIENREIFKALIKSFVIS